MKYLLDEDEYRDLVPKETWREKQRALEFTQGLLKKILHSSGTGAFCVGGGEYRCDFCPLSDRHDASLIPNNAEVPPFVLTRYACDTPRCVSK